MQNINSTDYSKRAFALQYPNGNLVAIDTNSGGYPYEATDIRHVWIAEDREALERYLKAGNSEGLKIVPITIEVRIG